MMRNIFVLTAVLLLVFGCLGPEPQPPEETPTCEEYCSEQPHVQCTGDWNISGSYPACVCQFVCDTTDEPEQISNPAAENCVENGYDYEIRGSTGYCSYNGMECEEWALFRGECCLTETECDVECDTGGVSCVDNTCQCPEPEEEPEAPVSHFPVKTEKSVEDLIDEVFLAADSEFYSGVEGGNFTQKTYKWILNPQENSRGTIPVGNRGVEGDILFDNNEMRGSIGFGAKTYVQVDGLKQEAYAISVLDADNQYLKNFDSETDRLELVYSPPNPNVVLTGCLITERSILSQLNNSDRIIFVYKMKCTGVERSEE